jgi:hypothetical protein
MSRFLKSTSVGLAGTLLLLSGQMARAEWPDVVEAKAIAEEGFIYGLPIVMNYAVQYEYSVDKNSGQYKAPFNQISNEARVFSYKDTAIITPNSDTPYSMLWKDSPGADRESSWLPAPNDEIFLVMRLYWPKTAAPSVLPAGEGSWQPPAIAVAN